MERRGLNWARAFFFATHPQQSTDRFFDLGASRVQDRRMQSVMKFIVDTYVGFGNRTALEDLRAHRAGFITELKALVPKAQHDTNGENLAN
jgi:hypothetical protein